MGNTGKDFNGPWLMSQEFQIIEGGVGDFLPVAGYTESGEQVLPSITVKSRKDRDGENVFDPNGQPQVFNRGRINWWGRSEDWADKLGFRGPQDVESPGLEWTHIEAVVSGNRLQYFVNGKLVNEGTDSSFTEGKIMIQSEGAEIYFRRIDLEPLKIVRWSRSLAVSAFTVCLLVGSASPPGSSTFAQGATVDTLDPGVRLINVAEAAGLRFVYQHSPTPEKYSSKAFRAASRSSTTTATGGLTSSSPTARRLLHWRRRPRSTPTACTATTAACAFTDVTSAADLSGAGYAIGRRRGTSTTTATSICSSPARAPASSIAIAVTGGSRMSRRPRASAAATSLSPAAGSTTTMTAASISSSSTTCNGRPTGIRPAATRPAASSSIATRARSRGLPNRLYRNRGDRTFEDVSARAGLQAHVGKGMSASFADFDHDGHLDIFITNDAVPNFLFRNNGDGTFTETALLAGVSVPDTGRPTSSMGVDAQDYDNDGWEDIQFTALTGETFPLFRNDSAKRRGTFVEVTQPSGLGDVDREVVRLVLDCQRFRQRRLEGPVHRELARERSHRRFRGARVPPAEQPVPQRRPRAVP